MARSVAEWRRRLGAGGACTPGQTFDQTISNSTNDTWRHETAGWYNDQIYIYVGVEATGRYQHGSFRFTNVTIPAGATIEANSYLSVYVRVDNTAGAMDTVVACEDADSPAAPTSAAEFDAIALTTAQTSWDNISPTINAYNNSPSIEDSIQEVIDRGGWSSGNALQVMWKDEKDAGGNDNIGVEDEINAGTNPPKLHVEYCA